MNRDIFDTLGFPDTPGVYFWRAANGDILYVGKATSLRDRVRSYFASDIHVTRGDRIRQMVEEAAAITFEETDSVLEALILEANLIKRHQPPYNVAERDNKSFNYLVITNEAFPRVLVVRGRELFQEWNDKDIKSLYGPFPNGGALKDAMKLVRKIFPFRDKCVPFEAIAKKSVPFETPVKKGVPFEALAKKGLSFEATAKKGKPCFNKQLGLCPGVCDGSFTKAEYARTIRNISLLFSGKKVTLLKTLEREMKAAAKKEAFEAARELKRQVMALTHIRDISLVSDEMRMSTGGGGVRIECYDIAHTSGTETVGVMVAVVDGVPAKSQYRKFKIRGVGNNDTAALAQMLARRLAHSEWPLPRVFVVDGGKGQLNAMQKVLSDAGVAIPLIGVVKDDRHRPVGIIGDPQAAKTYEKEALLADAEAHRFAISWHRKRRQEAGGLTKTKKGV